MGYMETIETFDNLKSDMKFKVEYKDWFNKLEKYNEETKLEVVRDIINDINEKVDYKDGVLLTLEVYKNIQEVGLQLLKDYEKDDMI